MYFRKGHGLHCGGSGWEREAENLALRQEARAIIRRRASSHVRSGTLEVEQPGWVLKDEQGTGEGCRAGGRAVEIRERQAESSWQAEEISTHSEWLSVT